MLEKYLPRREFGSYEDFKANYRVLVPEKFNFGFDILDGWAEKEPEKLALQWADDRGEERRFTFADMKAASNRIANYFCSLGVRKGDRVMLILRRRFEYWQCAVALHKLGAVLIPASSLLTEKDLIYRCNAANIVAIVAVDADGVPEHVDKALPHCPTIRRLILVAGEKREGWDHFDACVAGMSDRFPRPRDDEATTKDDPMIIYFTSGTTGMPKMVLQMCSYPLGHIVTAKYWQCVAENGLHLTVSDSGWAKFGWGKIYGQWLCGAAIMGYDMDRFAPERLLDVMEKYPIVTFCAPPTIYRYLMIHGLEKRDLSHIRHYSTAGEPLSPDIANQFYKVTGRHIHEGYGQSESSVFLGNFPWNPAVAGSIGKPSPIYDIALLDEEGNVCLPGDEGEIVIRGAGRERPVGLFSCYLSDGGLNANAFRGGDYHTGDMAWMDEAGNYWFVGRNDDMIKCSGYRIGPFEVESVLMEHPSVLECAITAVEDPLRGQVVKATIKLRADFTGDGALVKELQEHVKRVTAPYKYPRVVEFVDELPKTTTGKISRAQIRKIDREKKCARFKEKTPPN